MTLALGVLLILALMALDWAKAVRERHSAHSPEPVCTLDDPCSWCTRCCDLDSADDPIPTS